MPQAPQQWVYSALVGVSLLLVGWLWQIVQTQSDQIAKLQDTKADKTQAADRWTGSQQVEYMRYIDSRFRDQEKQLDQCTNHMKGRVK